MPIDSTLRGSIRPRLVRPVASPVPSSGRLHAVDLDRTVPSRVVGIPVKTVRVEVTGGPDAGRDYLARSDSVTIGTADGNDLVLTDPTVSRYHLELRRHGDRILAVDLGSTNGTAIGSVLVERGSVAVPPGTMVEVGQSVLRVGDGAVVTLPIEESGEIELHDLKGGSMAMRRLKATVRQVARSDASVLIVGESGTGKELIARTIHEGGSRAARPFVTIDCGAITPTLFTSALFGHEKGAFTGADRPHAGAFEQARSGTVFLDEIGDLPREMQSALLGVLERRKFRRVGGGDEIDVDVRFVSATNHDLRADVNAGAFRLDLYYRIAVVLLEVPALRERTGDIPLLVEHFLREAGHAGPVESVFPAGVMDELLRHAWPGNARELRNFVESTLAVGRPPSLVRPIAAAASADLFDDVLSLEYKDARGRILDEFERRYLTDLLKRSGGSVRQAARLAHMDRKYLIELLRRHGMRSSF